ncbi:MAG: hypothetical protein PHU85_20565 [Phycisphaerae bacterium]|jgi:D-glycero-alpha-D-manno-heptose-7-phosphate kinase|nr:hypothetical protein [Phycisphaerae bacterium]
MPEAIARAPVRISFAGGGTDVSPYPEIYGGSVTAAAVLVDREQQQEVKVRMRQDSRIVIRSTLRKDPIIMSTEKLDWWGPLGFVIHAACPIWGHYPGCGFDAWLTPCVGHRSGLGGSGAMMVAAIAAFDALLPEKQWPRVEGLANHAYDLEHNIIKNATGRQDQWLAALGGVQRLEFTLGGTTHYAVNVSNTTELKLMQGLMLFNLGARNDDSGDIIREQAQRVRDENEAVIVAMMHTARQTMPMAIALEAGNIPAVGELLADLWEQKKKFHDKISNPRVDLIHEKLTKAGMIGGKVTGAGSGGHFLACCDESSRVKLLAAGEDLGLKYVPFRFARNGVTVSVSE